VQRWFHDGDTECFSERHLPVALLSLFVLLLCVVLIPVVLVIALGKLPSLKVSSLIKEFSGIWSHWILQIIFFFF